MSMIWYVCMSGGNYGAKTATKWDPWPGTIKILWPLNSSVP